MSLTTDLSGGLFGPTREEIEKEAQYQKQRRLLELQQEGAVKLAEARNAPLNPRREPVREAQAFTRAFVAGKGLGDETSYGGQGPLFPEETARSEARLGSGQQEFARPIPVTRGMTTTYQGPRYGEEFAAPGQAVQAFRREQGAAFVPGGGAMEGLKHQNKLEEIAAQGKSQEAALAGDVMTRKRNLEAFMNRVQSDPRFYKEGPEGLGPVVPGLGQLVMGFKAMGEADPEKAFQAFEAKAVRHLDENKWVNDQGITKAVENLTKAGYALTPGQKLWLTTPQTDAEAEKKRRDTILHWVNPPAVPDKTQGRTPQPQNSPGTAQPLFLDDKMVQVGPRGEITPFQIEIGPRGEVRPFKPLPALPGPGLLRPDQYSRLMEEKQRGYGVIP